MKGLERLPTRPRLAETRKDEAKEGWRQRDPLEWKRPALPVAGSLATGPGEAWTLRRRGRQGTPRVLDAPGRRGLLRRRGL